MRKILIPLLSAILLFTGYWFFFRGSNKHFAEYAIGKTDTVNFDFPSLSKEEFSDREKADQAKDWLLYSLISNSGLKRKEVAEATFDLAPVRYGFNASLANFDYGDTRCKFIGNGEVIALVPIVSDAKARIDDIAHIVDEVRKDQGEKPQTVYVFEYDLNTEAKFARLTRKDDIDAASYFTEKMGYYESSIESLDDMKRFIEKTDDVTYVSQNDNKLVFGGRELGKQYGKATVEDVAAIWQSEKYIEEKQTQEQLSSNSIENDYKVKLDSVNNNYNAKLEYLIFKDGTAFSDLQASEKKQLITYIQSEIDNTKTNEPTTGYGHSEYESDSKLAVFIAAFNAAINTVDAMIINSNKDEEVVASSSGFSLDPAVDFKQSIEFVESFREWFEEALNPDFTVNQLLEQLKHRKGDLMQYALAKVEKDQGLIGSLIEKRGTKTCIYQKARYDGKLQGTAVGMTLFYTDLMAKIWAGNRFNSKPIEDIVGFKDHEQSYLTAPKVFNLESASLPAVRLWFGPNKNGFQSSGESNTLLFARNATQIFALSNDPSSVEGITKEGKSKNLEGQASAEFDIALSWWNNHFEEVGIYEPQYERLNEIMKWSTVISWLNNQYFTSALSFLDDYPVTRDLWFSDWAKNNKELKFSDWEKVSFFSRGHLEDVTEAIPILYSPNEIIHGGVSLAEKSLIKEAPELLSKENSLFRRSNIVQNISEGENAFITFKETKINFVENANAKTINIELKPKEGFKLRNRFGEIENNRFELAITEESSGSFTFKSKLQDVPIGELYTRSTGTNGFSIGFQSQAIDRGMTVAKQCSDVTSDIGAFLKNNPEVERYFSCKNGDWGIQLKNSDDWMVMHINPEEAEGSVSLQNGWQARTSGNKTESRIIEMKWVKEDNALSLTKDGKLPDRVLSKNLLDESPESLKKRILKEKGETAVNREMEQIQKDGISQAEALAGNNEFEKAVLQTEKLINHFGETPKLSAMRIRYELRSGLAALEKDNLQSACNYLNEALTSQSLKMNTKEFLTEINTMIDRSDIPANYKAKIAEMSKAYFTDQQMIIPGNWEGYKSMANTVSTDVAFSKKSAKIFYADNASFRNIDPASGIETILGQVRSIPGVKVYDISAEAIGKNTRMYAVVEPEINSYGIVSRKLKFHVSPGSAFKNCKDRDENGNCKDLYTINGPVYFVTAPSLN
ncbi:MAG: hypothetical protein ABI691_23670 [Ginsengibacter sp.]